MIKKIDASKNKLKTADICGWYGMCAMILAYALVSLNVLKADEITYQLLNITGGAGLLIVAESKHVIQSVIANLFWVLIGIVIVSRMIFGL
jgi:hypothetical protein